MVTLYGPVDGSLPDSSAILQARVLEWTAIPFSGGGTSPWRRPRDRTGVSCIGRRILYCLSYQGSPSACINWWRTGRTSSKEIIKDLATAGRIYFNSLVFSQALWLVVVIITMLEICYFYFLKIVSLWDGGMKYIKISSWHIRENTALPSKYFGLFFRVYSTLSLLLPFMNPWLQKKFSNLCSHLLFLSPFA